jgi:hypothetical protein
MVELIILTDEWFTFALHATIRWISHLHHWAPGTIGPHTAVFRQLRRHSDFDLINDSVIKLVIEGPGETLAKSIYLMLVTTFASSSSIQC